jgi:type II secretory pathway pseudopilin PulG
MRRSGPSTVHRPPSTALGATLIELLVTVALLTVVAGTMMATFVGGVTVSERLQAQGTQDQWLQVVLGEFRRDLRSARRFQPILFEGSYDAVSFASLVPSGADASPDSGEVGQLGYFWDSARHRLCRSHHPYRWLRQVRLKDSCDPVFTQIDRVRFSYYTVDPQSETSTWSTSWSSADPPLAVKVEVGYQDHVTQRPVTHSLIVPLPAAPHPLTLSL